MSTPSGPFTVRKWLAAGHPGAVVLEGARQILSTATDAQTEALIAGLQATLAAPTPPPPPPASSATVTYARVAIASAAAATLGTPTPNESVIITQAWEAQAAKAANPDAKVLIYFNLGGMTTGPVTNGLYPALPYNAAYGLGAAISGYSTLQMADVGNPAYKTAWATMAIKQAQQVGADGVFADNTDLIPSGNQTKYSASAYQAEVGGMLAFVYPTFKAAGVLLVPNLGSCSSYPQTAINWLPYVDGFMDEQFLKWGTTAGTGYRGAGSETPPSGAIGQILEAKAAADAGKLFIGVTHSADGDQAAATYGLATLLLTGGTYCFSSPPEYATESLPAAWSQAAALGEPTGSYTGSNGVYQRKFQNGIVSVNMTTSPPTGTITLN